MENSILNSFQQQGLADLLIDSATTESQFKLFSLLKPKIYKDGDKWCVLYGDNLQEGVVGFGKTPQKAVSEWTNNWYCES
tara:strand:+ start:11090 stop:11329 length:240 start_codon:yes stop_codon:yes gene_type:complete